MLCVSLYPARLSRHLHIIIKSENTKIYTVDRAATSETFVFVTLTYGGRTVNRMDSLYQTVNGLVGNVDWGESLTVAACEFLGLNSFGSRRRATSAWLAEETRFPEIIPSVTVLKAVGFIILFQKKGVKNTCFLLTTRLLII